MWFQGRDAALDVTVTSPLQQAQIHRAAAEAGAALEAAKSRKMAKSYEKCRRVGVKFIPLAVETLGGWHEDAVFHISAIGRQLSRQSATSDGTATRHLFQRLAVFLQRGNATLLMGRRPQYPPSDIIGPD
jgi:hypothetical protein